MIGAVVLGACGSSLASEPVAAVRIVPEWIDEPGGRRLDPPAEVWVHERPLRLTVAPLVSTSAVELRVVSNDEVRWRLVEGEDPIASPALEDPAYRIPLGALFAGQTRSFVFALRSLTGRGGVVSFEVHATLPDGREVRDAAGVALGGTVPSSRERFGAIEFPAATVAAEHP